MTEADTDLIDDIIVVDDVGSVVTDASLAMKVIGYYQDYVFLTSFEYNASSNYLLASPRDFGQGGTINVNSSNYFRFYIPYDAEQDDQTNIILNTVSGLGNSNVRRRIWKEVIYYSLTQRPIHKFLEEIDEFHYGEHLYDGKIDKWQQRVIETSHILDRISQGEAGASATVSSIANYIKVGNNILISDITDLDRVC